MNASRSRSSRALIAASVLAITAVGIVSILSTSFLGALCGVEENGYCGQLKEGWSLGAWLLLLAPVVAMTALALLTVRHHRTGALAIATIALLACALLLPLAVALLWP